tara:strand:- start:598 stop:1134 length:537 start_codon:yes stop_codon:yes gene_type:complete
VNFYRLGKVEEMPGFSPGSFITSYGETIDNEFKGIKYCNAFVSFSNTYSDFVSLDAFKNARKTVMTINREIPPHTDSGVQCVINIYTRTSNCLTQFYDIVGEPDGFQIENQTDGQIFDLDALVPADSFVAEVGDVILLNVKAPHSVKPLTSAPVDREALCFQSRALSFHQVLALLQKG